MPLEKTISIYRNHHIMKFRLKNILFALIALVTFSDATCADSPVELELVRVKKVWDKAPHNAFTDLILYKNKLFLTFREAATHSYEAPTGNIRVLCSKDGEKWESVSLIQYGTDNDDLRDSKLSVTPNGKLLLLCALSPKENHKTIQTLAYLSDDGIIWDGPHKIGEPNWWIWRVVWNSDGVAYGIGYNCQLKSGEQRQTRLYRSKDGLNYEILLPKFTPQNVTSETGLIFRKDTSAVALVRRDGKVPNSAIVGTSNGNDYGKWTFKELKQRMGGPQIIETKDGPILASGRLYDGKVRTSVGLLDPKSGEFTELLKLPSGGDCSYPGMVFYNEQLLVSYYSSHEGKTCIYVAKIKIKPPEVK